jgi:hypothetical protein
MGSIFSLEKQEVTPQLLAEYWIDISFFDWVDAIAIIHGTKTLLGVAVVPTRFKILVFVTIRRKIFVYQRSMRNMYCLKQNTWKETANDICEVGEVQQQLSLFHEISDKFQIWPRIWRPRDRVITQNLRAGVKISLMVMWSIGTNA